MRDVKHEKLKTACFRKLPQREEWERSRWRKYAELKTACFRKLPQREEWKRSGHESLCLEGQVEEICGT